MYKNEAYVHEKRKQWLASVQIQVSIRHSLSFIFQSLAEHIYNAPYASKLDKRITI